MKSAVSTATAIICLFSGFASAANPVGFERIEIDLQFRSEGVATADVNKDGKQDVVVGDYWYENPGWTAN